MLVCLGWAGDACVVDEEVGWSIGLEEESQVEAKARTAAREEASRERTWILAEEMPVASMMLEAASWALEALRQAR